MPAPGLEPAGWTRQPQGPTPTPGAAAHGAEGSLQGPKGGGPGAADRRPPAGARRQRRGAPWDEPPPCSGPRSQTEEGGAAPPLNAPASPAPNPPETSVRLVAAGLRLPIPDHRCGVSLRAAYAASGWRVASSRPVRLAGSRNFPSAPRSVPRLTQEAGGETPGATNRRAVSGPVHTGGERGFPGEPSLQNQGPTSPAHETRGLVPGKPAGGTMTV